PVGDGFELAVSTEVQLAPGLNTVVVEARNEGGPAASPTLLVNYVPLPPRVVLDALEPQDGIAPRRTVSMGPDGTLTCEPVTKARRWLHGRVVWELADARLAAKQPVSVYVNGSQQWRGELAPAAGGKQERAFKAEILLNRPKGNKIEIVLPDLK